MRMSSKVHHSHTRHTSDPSTTVANIEYCNIVRLKYRCDECA